jgi:hypothetical protein
MMDHKQPTNLIQMKHTSLNGLIPDQKSNATSNYNEPSDSSFISNQFTASTKSYPTVNLSFCNRIVHKRRNQRKLRREIKCSLNDIKRLPLQITNDSFAFQFFNGSPF